MFLICILDLFETAFSTIMNRAVLSLGVSLRLLLVSIMNRILVGFGDVTGESGLTFPILENISRPLLLLGLAPVSFSFLLYFLGRVLNMGSLFIG